MKFGRVVLAIVLALVAGPVAALGLGQIQVKSKVEQPLLAEIPIISGDPAELEQLQARLASPETFARVGLPPPTGAAADLDFSVALDDRGRPVIRVTSQAPVRQPLVTFLVEVDWGSGRLVREYAALLDTPRTVAAPAQPPIEAPVLAPSNVIERPVAQPAFVAEVPVEPVPTEPEAAPTDTPVIPRVASATPDPDLVPDPAPVPVAMAPAAPVARPDQLKIQSGQTLWEIAKRVSDRGYTLDQTMLALLRANPDAFVGGNINLLKSGAVLRVPPAEDAAELSDTEAAVVVRVHLEQWRAMRAPAPPPVAGADTAPSKTASSRDARISGARLEIAPPSSGANTPGSRSGASAGGEGDMLRQELQQSKEELAARNAEVEELKSRVAELEKLRQDQAALLEFKDSKLAAAEQGLAQANATQADTAQPTQTPPAIPTWLWGGLVLLVFGITAWVLARRRTRMTPTPEPRRIYDYDTEALAAGMPKVPPLARAAEPAAEPLAVPPAFADASRKTAPPAFAEAGRKTAPPAFADASRNAVPPAFADASRNAAPPAFAEASRNAAPPAFAEANRNAAPPAFAEADPDAAPSVDPATRWTPVPAPASTLLGAAPTWHASGMAAATVAEPETASQQLELARAYLDMGDDVAARKVLREILDSRDPVARDAAARMLRDL